MNDDGAPSIEELKDRIRALEKTNAALMKRVERSIDSAGGSFSLFESNILLHSKVRERTRELEERQIELLRLKNQAEAANRAKTEFLATMSHELRTPLNGVLGMAQMLLDPNLSEQERQEYVRTILSSGQALLMLLNDILDLSKVEAGKLELESVAVAPFDLLLELKALFEATSREKKVPLRVSWHGPRAQRYSMDPHRLRQMLSNLVGNAFKFTSKGNVRVDACEIDRVGNIAELVFEVQDTGIGIAKDKQGHLFQPFSQADSSITRKFSGTGLGLSIVRYLAELMGGGVGVESDVGEGARFLFRVRVPIVVGEPIQTSSRDSAPNFDVASGRPILWGGILIAEDNVVNQRVVAQLCERVGLTVKVVSDGLQAVSAVSSGEKFDLILMDVQMPEMDGLTAAAKIREWERSEKRSPVPIIALTAAAFDEDRRMAKNAGMDDFLVKPISVTKLDEMLVQWLKK